MKRQELLLKAVWNCKDVCEYLECKKSKAYELMKVARNQFSGDVRFNSRVVKRDSLLLAIGSYIEREIYILNQMKGGGCE